MSGNQPNTRFIQNLKIASYGNAFSILLAYNVYREQHLRSAVNDESMKARVRATLGAAVKAGLLVRLEPGIFTFPGDGS